jgi:hypothetical protein
VVAGNLKDIRASILKDKLRQRLLHLAARHMSDMKSDETTGKCKPWKATALKACPEKRSLKLVWDRIIADNLFGMHVFMDGSARQ